MGLGHFTNVATAFNIWEPVYKSLFEIQITLPPLVYQNLGGGNPDIKTLLIENATSFPFPTYPKIDVKDQRFKYSTRAYPGLPGQTHLTDQSIKFNLNESVNVRQNQTGVIAGRVPIFRAIKDWYDLLWNNETGQLNYKGNLIGEVICDQHDKEGLVIRRVIWHNAFITGFTGWEDVDWSNPSDIADLTASFALDYWEDLYY
jgi:hypothetical protein